MRRRNFLAALGSAASLASLPIEIREEIKVYEDQDLVQVPTFNNGQRLDAETLNSLSRAIIQLQGEIQILKSQRKKWEHDAG